jgi:hypothetical protein
LERAARRVLHREKTIILPQIAQKDQAVNRRAADRDKIRAP